MADESDTGGAACAATVFLSYARADQARAAQLAGALQAAGLTVWWDALMEGGAAFAASIADALDAADAVLVLWSDASIASDWVRDEAAQGRERRRLVPLLLDASKPPLGFRQYQAIDLSAWRGDRGAPQIGAILRAVAAACDRPLPALPPPAPRRVSRRRIGYDFRGCARSRGSLPCGRYRPYSSICTRTWRPASSCSGAGG